MSGKTLTDEQVRHLSTASSVYKMATSNAPNGLIADTSIQNGYTIENAKDMVSLSRHKTINQKSQDAGMSMV